MKLQVSIQAALLGLFIGLVASGEARAASFSFTRIADTNGGFSSFNNAASINNGGTVAFQANLNAGGSGIFTGNGITTTTIANTNGTFTSFGDPNVFGDTPDINDAGTVAFVARQTIQNQRLYGVFTGNGTTTNTITTVPTSGPNGENIGRTSSFHSANINNTGNLAFVETIVARADALFTSDGTTVNPITSATLAPVIDPILNEQGTVAYGLASFQINTNNGTTTTTIANRDDFSFVSNPSINNRGTVTFTAGNNDGNGRPLSQVLFTSDGTTRTAIADTSGLFSSFGATAINDARKVAFLGTLDTGETGIFAGTNPLTDRVIATGDSLFGSTVTNLAFNNQALNNSGSVAFFAQLADGTQGIFRADLVSSQPTSTVPEPASTLGLIAFGAIGVTRVLKRTQKKRIKLAS